MAMTALLAGCAQVAKLPVPVIGLPSLADPPPPSRAEAIKRLKSAKPCCHAWDELPFHRALPDKPGDFLFDRFSPVAELDGHRTHYLSFMLPIYHNPYKVLFKAQPSARHLQSSYLFAPTTTVLDANFKPLRSDDIKLCEYIGWRPSQSGAFGSFAIHDKRAKYLVITTSDAQLKATTYWEQSPAGFTSDVFSDPASRGHFSIPHGPDGTLSVGLLTPDDERAISGAICGKPDKQ